VTSVWAGIICLPVLVPDSVFLENRGIDLIGRAGAW